MFLLYQWPILILIPRCSSFFTAPRCFSLHLNFDNGNTYLCAHFSKFILDVSYITDSYKNWKFAVGPLIEIYDRTIQQLQDTLFKVRIKFLIPLCPVGWGCRIHRLLLCRGVRPPPPKSVLDMTLNDLMVRFQWCWSFGECGVPLHCHRSQVHSSPEW